MATTTPAAQQQPTASPTHRWWLLAVLALAQLMVVLDGTIVNIALPEAQLELGMSDGDRTWVVTIYALAFGSLLLLGGRVADYWGRKRSFVVGMIGFAVASAIGGFAVNTEMLLAARALQGVFAALLAPAALAILTITFPSGKERIKAFSVFGAIGGGGAAIGLLLGGALAEFASWEWCLLVNVPIAVIAIIGALVFMTESRASGNTKYDIPGTLLVVAGLASLVFGFSRAEEGWARFDTIALLAAGVVLLAAFVLVESRVSNPLLPLRVIVNKVRGGAFLVSALTGSALLGGLLFLIFYFQIVLGYSPLQSGLASLPMTAVIMVTVGVLSNVLPKIGVRIPMTVGPILAAAGLFYLSFITVEGNYLLEVLPGLVILGIGLGAIFVPLQNVALAGVENHDAGVASAAVTATQQIGGSIGTALFTALYTSAIASYLADNPASPTVQFESLVSGYSAAFVAAAVLMVIGAPIAYFLIRPSKEDLLKNADAVHMG